MKMRKMYSIDMVSSASDTRKGGGEEGLRNVQLVVRYWYEMIRPHIISGDVRQPWLYFGTRQQWH